MASPKDPASLHLASGLWSLPALKLVRAWKECAGPALLKQTKFLGVEREGKELVLRLEVADPVWRQELEYQRDSILENYRRALLRLGYPESGLPRQCLLTAGRSLPFKARYAKK